MNQRAQWLADHVLPHEPALRRWLRANLSERFDIDDIVQESYAVLAALADVSHVLNPRSYLFTTAQSVVLQQVRRARIVAFESVAEVDRLDVAQDEFDPERHAVAGEELRRIAELIHSLPRKCGQAFVLRKVEGLSQREIAARMGISENTVEKHICKGLRLLMDEMKQDRHADAIGRQAGPEPRLRRDERRDGD